MPKSASLVASLIALALTWSVALPAAAQGKIVCWKDKTGKVVGCGDTVPPEYQQNATKELDKRGVTRNTTESAEEQVRSKQKEQERAQQKADDARRQAEQKRQDSALLATFTSEKEIDIKRDRDLQVVDLQISQMQVSLKNAAERQKETQGRVDAAAKSGKPVPDVLKEELSKVNGDREKLEQNIKGKEAEKEDIRKRYADYKKRFAELRGDTPNQAAAKK